MKLSPLSLNPKRVLLTVTALSATAILFAGCGKTAPAAQTSEQRSEEKTEEKTEKMTPTPAEESQLMQKETAPTPTSAADVATQEQAEMTKLNQGSSSVDSSFQDQAINVD